MTRGLALLTLLAGAGSCGPRPATPANDPAPASRPASEGADGIVVTLERTPCLGGCPVYLVTISGSGLVRFEGRSFVAQLGSATAQLPTARVDSLLAELEAGGYFGFAERYLSGSPACGRYATDSPTAITSVTARGRTKRIEHDYGCGDAPTALARLERRIDEVAGTAEWTGR